MSMVSNPVALRDYAGATSPEVLSYPQRFLGVEIAWCTIIHWLKYTTPMRPADG